MRLVGVCYRGNRVCLSDSALVCVVSSWSFHISGNVTRPKPTISWTLQHLVVLQRLLQSDVGYFRPGGAAIPNLQLMDLLTLDSPLTFIICTFDVHVMQWSALFISTRSCGTVIEVCKLVAR